MNRWYTRDRFLRLLLPAAVAIEVAHDLSGITHAVMAGDRVLLPGAIARTLLMGALGILAIFRRSSRARWLFAGVQYATAAVTLVFAFFTIPEGKLTFEPGPLVMFFGYLLLGIAASVGTVRQVGEQTVAN